MKIADGRVSTLAGGNIIDPVRRISPAARRKEIAMAKH
jgi:hypothetical protein